MNFVFSKPAATTVGAIALFLSCAAVTANDVAAQGIELARTNAVAGPLAVTDTLTSASSATESDTLNESAPAVGSGLSRNEALIASLTIFALAVFVGFEIIVKIPPTLHTPLMSGSNAISGITLVGAALVAGSSRSGFAGFLGMLAVALAATNAVGGFMVTDRMLSMFRKKK